MLRFRRAGAAADVVHWQWLGGPRARRALLPAARRWRADRARASLPAAEAGAPGCPGQRGAPSPDGRGRSPSPSTGPRCFATRSASTPERVHVIPHGPFDYLTAHPRRGAAARRAGRGRGAGDPVLRPDPPVQGRRPAARGVSPDRGRRAVDRGQAAGCRHRAACASWRRALPVHRPLRPALRRRPRDPGAASAAPTSSSCPTARPSSRACSTRAALRQGDRDERRRRLRARSAAPRRRPPRSARRRRARSPTPWPSWSPTSPLAERLGEAALAAAAGPILLGRDRRRTWRSTGELRAPIIRPMPPRGRVLGLAAGLLVYTHLGYPLVAVLALTRLRAQPEREGAVSDGELPRVAADRRRPRRGGGDRAAGGQPLALDYPRDRLRGDRRLRRLGATAPPSWLGRRAPTASSSWRAGARTRRSNAAVAPATSEVLAFSDANASWEPDALRQLVASDRRSQGRLRLRAGALRRPGGAPTRRACTGDTRWRCARWSRGSAGVTAGNGGDQRGPPRGLRVRSTRRRSHDLSFPFQMVKRGLARGLRARGQARGADGGRRRGRVSPASAG